MRAQTVRRKLAVLWALGAVILAGVGFTVWFAYHSSQAADTALKSANKVSSDVPKTPVVNSYDTCTKAPGSKILTTSPSQCITAGGKTFTETTQAAKYLVITEWQVRIPLAASDITDAEYTLSSGGDMAHITTKALTAAVAKVPGCHSGLNDIYLSRSKTEPELTPGWGPKKVGSYYYFKGSVMEPMCVTAGSDSLATIQSIQNDLAKAVPLVEANQ